MKTTWSRLSAFGCQLLLAMAAGLMGAGTMTAQSGVTSTPETLSKAPLNPHFVEYMDARAQGLTPAMVTAEGYGLGFVPGPLDLSHLKTQPTALSFGTPPASYDLRIIGKVTPVRDQGVCGSCWAFATYGSLESALMPGEARDFSENNLKNLSGFDSSPCSGGQYLMSMAYLARWNDPTFQAGPVNESDDPYNPSDTNTSTLGKPVQKHIQDVILLAARASASDNTTLKNAVMTYGGVLTSMYAGSTTDPFNSYYNQTTHSFYYSGSAAANHNVTLAGWDDNYPASNFLTPPPGNGAFLIKNSWGTSWPSDGGYFWISYYDSIYARTAESAVFWAAESPANYTRQYEYDPLGWDQVVGWTLNPTTAWFANVFTAATTEQLKAVATYVGSPNSPYVINIYTGATSGPTSGTLVANTSGTFALAGYHTVVLPSPVGLTAGQQFSVVMELTTPGFNYPIPVEDVVAGYSSKAVASPGQSFVSSDGSSWADLTSIFDSTANIALKAFAGSSGTTYTLTLNRAGTGLGTVASNDGLINCGPSCTGNYASGTVVTLTATPALGSIFFGWSGGGCSGTGSCSVTMSAAQSVTATFNTGTNPLTVNLAGTGTGTVTSSPAGINCPGTCSAAFQAGSNVTLTATPNAGSTFGGWGGACLGSSCSITMSSAELATATFATNSPVLSLLSPSSAIAGGGNPVALSVTGANFVNGANVVWNGTNLTTNFINSSGLQATIPAGNLATPAVASVTVTNPSGGGTSNALTFDILEAFGGSGGYLSMFVNGADLGNSALFQGNCPATGQPCIGVGNTAPMRTLDVSGEIQARGGNLFLQRNMTDSPNRRNWAWGTETANYGDMAFFVSTSNTNFPSVNVMTLLSNGNVGIGPVATTPVTPLQVGGDIRVGTTGTNGCLQNFSGAGMMGTCTSDARLKSNILPFAPLLDKLVKLQPVHFDWNIEQYPDYHFGAGRNSGLLAQDVEKVFPDLVFVDAHGFKTVNYSELPYLTLAAIRELKTENDSLRTQIAERNKEVAELYQQVVSVRARLDRLEKKQSDGAKEKPAKRSSQVSVTKTR